MQHLVHRLKSFLIRRSRAFKRTPGFTLIEMAIVLVIIGLIVGAIFVGKDLIHTAKLRKVQSEVDQLVVAVNTFNGKFNCIPGDCANATTFFTAGNCNGTSESVTAACNGNGDGTIDTNTEPSYDWDYQENFYLWRELNAAGLLSPQIGTSIPCVGFNCSGGYGMQNVPQGSYANNSILFITDNKTIVGSWAIGSGAIPADYTNALVSAISGYVDTGGGLVGAGRIFPAADAQWIDTKFDDGSATTGKIIAGAGPWCFNQAAGGTGTPVPYGNPTYGGSGVCGLVWLRLF